MKVSPDYVFLAAFPFVFAAGIVATSVEKTKAAVPEGLPTPKIIVVPDKPVQGKSEYLDTSALKKVGLTNRALTYASFKNGKVEWNDSMSDMWDRKMTIHGLKGSVKKSRAKIEQAYKTSGQDKLTIKQHLGLVKNEINLMNANFRWAEICDVFHLDTDHCVAYKHASTMVDAQMLTAYSMTEIMPFRDGEQNYVVMDLYMSHAGRNFLDNVPSFGDPLLSIGRYQFTSYAVGQDENGDRSTNKLSQYVTGYRLPGSVITLKGIENDRAAYLFASFNLMQLIRSMNNKEAVTFTDKCMSKKSLVQYIATAHHNPKWAKTYAINWIDHGCSKELLTYEGRDLTMYAKKTLTNYSAVLRHNQG